MLAERWLISGRVQGVSFRWFTRDQASRLGLVGTVRNLTDGRVEVVVAGDGVAIEKLRQAVADGPPMARVSAVDRMPLDEAESSDIATRPDFEITF